MPRRNRRPAQEQLAGRNGHRSSRPGPPSEADGFAIYLLAQIGRLDTRPETIAAMQRGLDAAWDVVDQHAQSREEQ